MNTASGWVIAVFYAEESPGSTQTGCWITSSGVGLKPILGKVPQKRYRRLRRNSEQARVKRCGKSVPCEWQHSLQGKPHPEQDQIGAKGF